VPNLVVTVNHSLSQGEALQRIQTVVAQAKVQYSEKINDLRESWNGYVGAFQISAQNQQISVTVAVNPSDVTVEIALPSLASMFKPMIESGLRDQLTRILK
jgi:hypothetical protein